MRALEKEMATHSSTLAWRIPGMEEPGGLPSMASQSCRPLKWLSSGSKHYVSRVLRWKHQPGGLRYWDLQSNTLESTPSPTSCRPGMVAGQIPSMLYTSLKWEPPAIIQILVNTKERMCNSDLQTKYPEYTLSIWMVLHSPVYSLGEEGAETVAAQVRPGEPEQRGDGGGQSGRWSRGGGDIPRDHTREAWEEGLGESGRASQERKLQERDVGHGTQILHSGISRPAQPLSMYLLPPLPTTFSKRCSQVDCLAMR